MSVTVLIIVYSFFASFEHARANYIATNDALKLQSLTLL